MFGTQQLLHEAVHLLGQRLVQVVGGFVHRIAVRAPVVQLHHYTHFGHCGHYVVDAILIDSVTMAFIVALIMALMGFIVALSQRGCHLICYDLRTYCFFGDQGSGLWGALGLTTTYSGLNGASLDASLSGSSLDGCS